MRNRLRLCVLTAIVAFGAPTIAKPPPVKVGKVTTEAPAPPEAQKELKATLVHEIEGMDLSKARERYVLDAALVKLETTTDKDRVESTCVVSASLSGEGGSLRAVMKGRAQATDGKDATQAAQIAAIQGAARSAVARLPEAVR